MNTEYRDRVAAAMTQAMFDATSDGGDERSPLLSDEVCDAIVMLLAWLICASTSVATPADVEQLVGALGRQLRDKVLANRAAGSTMRARDDEPPTIRRPRLN